MPTRVVHCEDAIPWITRFQALPGHSFVASLPDYSEFPHLTLDGWKKWFCETAGLILNACHADGVVIFYQSDIKHQGTWVDKSYLCQKAAEASGVALIWHKVFCRVAPGTTTFGRPAYSHLLCFSKNVRPLASVSSPDVVPELGDKVWERGMGLAACKVVGEFMLKHAGTHTVVNPFCGMGSMLAMANFLGMDAVGIERGRKRAEHAMAIQLMSDKNFAGQLT